MRSPHFTAAEVVRAVLLLVFAIAMAQAQSAASHPQQQHNPVAEVTIRGCLQPGAERTTLTDESGTTYLLQDAQASSQKRAWVEVRGQQLSPSGQRGQSALPEIHVITMRTLSDICPEKITPPPSNPKPPSPNVQSPATPPYQSPNAPQPQEGAPVPNTPGTGGAPSPGTGNTQNPQPNSPK